MKRGKWFKGEMKKDIQRGVAKGGRPFKKARKTFQRAGKPGQDKSAATVVFVPSTKGSLLLKTLKEDEERMAALLGLKSSTKRLVDLYCAMPSVKILGRASTA